MKEGKEQKGRERRRESKGIKWGGIYGKKKKVGKKKRFWLATRKEKLFLNPA